MLSKIKFKDLKRKEKTPGMLYKNLSSDDPAIHSLIKAEEKRQRETLNLIASENYTAQSILEVGGSILTNKYSEGKIGERYYGGNEYIDAIEQLCKDRALELYNLDSSVWDVNVQALSGTIANMAVYTALVGKDGKIMGMDLPSGGHLSHGYKTPRRKISATSLFFESAAYKCNENGELDYDAIDRLANEFKPGILICGASAYPRDFDYERLRAIAGDAYLMMDMSHISGFIAAGVMNNPFKYCDVVTTTTHKLLRGPRSALIFFRKERTLSVDGVEKKVDVKGLIDFAVFPGLHGGPHNQKIAGVAVALKQAKSEEYFDYIKQVYRNTQVMSEQLKEYGYKLYTDGTDCHMVLVCLEGVIGGAEVERICELAGISINKNCVVTDKSPLRPTGIRLGAPAMTTRGMQEDDFVKAVGLVHEAILLAKRVKEAAGSDFESFSVAARTFKGVDELRKKVIKLVSAFPLPVLEFQ